MIQHDAYCPQCKQLLEVASSSDRITRYVCEQCNATITYQLLD